MEHAGKLDPEIIRHCFELGLMAIESPEEYGGAGSTIFNAILAIDPRAAQLWVVMIYRSDRYR